MPPGLTRRHCRGAMGSMPVWTLQRLPPQSRSSAANMAIDAAMPAWGRARESAVLRFYGWSESALTFGYSQRFAEVSQYARAVLGFGPEATLVRRPSGGGVVDHRADLTYAFSLPRGHPDERETSLRFYCRLHDALATALGTCGIETELAPCPTSSSKAASQPQSLLPAACFADRPAPADVILPGSSKKLAGAALRRSPDGILAQGSLMRSSLPPEFDATALESAFADALAEAFALEPCFRLSSFPDTLEAPEAVGRFASRAWNERR